MIAASLFDAESITSQIPDRAMDCRRDLVRWARTCLADRDAFIFFLSAIRNCKELHYLRSPVTKYVIAEFIGVLKGRPVKVLRKFVYSVDQIIAKDTAKKAEQEEIASNQRSCGDGDLDERFEVPPLAVSEDAGTVWRHEVFFDSDLGVSCSEVKFT